MSDQLSMFGPTTSADTASAISSPASESGPTRSGLLAGQTTEKSGPEAVPANPSARPAKAKRSTTKGIFGQSSFGSSRHEDLSFALANKLRPLTDSLGSTLFSLTWMTRITPAGRSISALRASEPLTEGSVFIGWPTPQEDNANNAGGPSRMRGFMNGGYQDLNCAAMLAMWPTPRNRYYRSESAVNIQYQVRLAAWKTPCVPNGGRISGNLTDIGKHQDGTKAQIGLENEARLTAFGDQPIGYLLGPNGWEIVPASGQLNASHSRWLMGLPRAWDECGLLALRKLKKK